MADAGGGRGGGGGGGGGGAGLGKGAWDCDAGRAIPPEAEAAVFEEIATMDMPFEGIPTVPPPKDRDRLAFFAGGCRYLVSALPTETVAAVKAKLFAGGIARAYPGEVDGPGDLELYYACVRMEEEGARLGDYRVPAGCKTMIALSTTLMKRGLLPKSSAYWH